MNLFPGCIQPCGGVKEYDVNKQVEDFSTLIIREIRHCTTYLRGS